MQAHSLDCPNCGAPLDIPSEAEKSMRCPYCKTLVMIPLEMRAERQPVPPLQVVIGADTPRTPQRAAWAWLFFVILGLAVGGALLSVIIPLTLAGGALAVAVDQMQPSEILTTRAAKPAVVDVKIATPSPTPTLTPTPQFAEAAFTFGQAGISAGMLDDSRYLAVDGSDHLYVADYAGGRVQVFDSEGQYLSQWRIGDEKTIIAGMTADGAGRVSVAVNDQILRFDGPTGKPLAALSIAQGGDFGDLATGPDDRLYAAWYEQRWGMITSLQGHRDDLLVFSPEGELETTRPGWISGQTEDLALETLLAVDGRGVLYALDSYADAIFQFSSQGKLTTRFGGPGEGAGGLGGAASLAVDGQGRVYVGDSQQIRVFSSKGAALTTFTTGVYAERMVFDRHNHLWVLSRDRVTRFDLTPVSEKFP